MGGGPNRLDRRGGVESVDALRYIYAPNGSMPFRQAPGKVGWLRWRKKRALASPAKVNIDRKKGIYELKYSTSNAACKEELAMG